MHTDKDITRTAMQAPVGRTKLCVLYVKNRREHRTAWFYSMDRAKAALKIMQDRYGQAIIYRD